MRRFAGAALCSVLVAALAGVATASTEPVRGRVTAPAPQRIGAIEQAGTILDYLGMHRTTTLRYPGASYVKVHFSRLLLAPGDTVSVSDPQQREVHAYSHLAVGGGWAMSITGDTAVVAIHPHGLTGPLSGLGVAIDRVARGFTAAELRARTRGPESVCGTDDSADAVCYRSADPVAYDRSKAVARLLIDGVELCTAWRVGPNNRMFTNHHCLADTGSAQSTEVWFNYECEVCGGAQVAEVTKVWGNQVLATDRVLDYTLFTVRSFGAITQFGYLELDVRDPARGEELYIPQHPGGAPRRLSNCGVVDPRYEGYRPGTDVAYYCDTAGGSSGSPVLSRLSNKVVALHHFGGCPNSGVRIDLVYSEVGGLL
jgi:V8-like Glu-specific endopeptidase